MTGAFNGQPSENAVDLTVAAAFLADLLMKRLIGVFTFVCLQD